MFFLSCCGVDGVLKVDDDHRLRSTSELLRGFRRLKYRLPLQLGTLVRAGALGLHPRTWHFGKTSDPSFDAVPYSLPGTIRWANGASGYYLNRQALALLRWSYVYFCDYLKAGLYEDMLVSDLIERQGGHLADLQMSRILTTTDAY
jgi:hypothetical protein